jgi:hypothetical protein
MAHSTRTTSTPWGPATVVEKLSLRQQAGEKRFDSVVELLENDRGDQLIRVAYATTGTNRRGPDRLRAALAKSPGLAAVLGLEGA